MASINENEMLEELGKGIPLPPLELRPIESNVARELQIDVVLTADYRGEIFEFAAELKTRNTPSVFENAIRQAEKIATRSSYLPMLILPQCPATLIISHSYKKGLRQL